MGRRERRGSYLLLLGLGVLLGLLPASQAGARISPGLRAAATDTYYVHRGAGLDQSKAAPLVVVCCRGKATETQTGWSQEADRSGLVVAYLDFSKLYNDAERIRGPGSPFPDVTFIASLIDSVTKSQNIDPTRVYMAGGSAGGVLSYRSACHLSDKLAAIGSVSGVDVVPACRPPSPVSVIEIHGTADAAIPYNGQPGYMSTPETVAKWRSVDGCGPSSRVTTSGRIKDEVWSNCAASTAVELVTIAGGDHGWPRDSTFDSTAKLWRFFAAHPRVAKAALAAQLKSVTVRYRPRRSLLLRLSLNEPASVKVVLTRSGAAPLSRTFAAKSGTPALTLRLPTRVRAGTYILSVTATAGSDQRRFTRKVRLRR